MATEPNEEKPTTAASLMELAQLAPGSIIRTETVLSKMPIHNLSKKGSINIHIVRKGAAGQVDLSWRVSPSRDYGEPRQLAYKIDTLIINRKIEEAGRPLPPVIALGSIRQVCRDLGINEGKGSNDVKRAILQNSSAFISAKLTYTGNDGTVKRLDANFARYSVIFTGEKLPDGRTADGVYLLLNDPYREVLNNAPVRPLNYDYLRQLPPTQQRFYEIVSYRIFALLKNRPHDEARMAYSEYCTYSAQQRYFDYTRFKKQMYKVHRPHLASGYLKSIRYQETTDGEGKPDWFMYYVPGPKARAEYHAFNNAGRLPETVIESVAAGESAESRPIGRAKPRRSGPQQKRLRFEELSPETAPVGAEHSPAFAELTRRGISPSRATELLHGADPKLLIDQLEWGDHLITKGRPGGIVNPPGFYISLIAEKITPPEGFETSRQRQARERARAERDQEEAQRLTLEDAYSSYRAATIEEYVAANVAASELETVTNQKMKELKKERPNMSAALLKAFAEHQARTAIAERVPLLTMDEFRRSRQNTNGQATAPSFA